MNVSRCALWIAALAMSLTILNGCGSGNDSTSNTEGDKPTGAAATKASDGDASSPDPANNGKTDGGDTTKGDAGTEDDASGDGDNNADGNESDDEAKARQAALDKLIARINAMRRDADFLEARQLIREHLTNFRGHQGYNTLSGLSRQIRDEMRIHARLEQWYDKLASDDAATRDVARKELITGGEVGRILLYKTVREGSDQAVLAAADALADIKDEHGFEVIGRRVLAKPDSPIRLALIEELAKGPEYVNQQVLATLVDELPQAEKQTMEAILKLMSKVMVEVAEGDEAKFNERVGQGAFDKVKATLSSLMKSKDTEQIEWASRIGVHFDAWVIGLKGEYFVDDKFKKLELTRVDKIIKLEDRKAPLPKQDYISARWTGYLYITKPGEYKFWFRGDDAYSVTLDDKQIISGSVDERSATVELEPGLHPITVKLDQQSGNVYGYFYWQPPGAEERSFVPATAMRTRPWPGMKAEPEAKPDDKSD